MLGPAAMAFGQASQTRPRDRTTWRALKTLDTEGSPQSSVGGGGPRPQSSESSLGTWMCSHVWASWSKAVVSNTCMQTHLRPWRQAALTRGQSAFGRGSNHCYCCC